MADPYRKAGGWYIRYKDASGRWRDRATKARTKAEAKRIAAELELREERIRQGLEVPPPEDGGGTLDALLEWWIDAHLAKSASFKNSAGTIRCHLIGSDLGSLRLVDVRSAEARAL